MKEIHTSALLAFALCVTLLALPAEASVFDTFGAGARAHLS